MNFVGNLVLFQPLGIDKVIDISSEYYFFGTHVYSSVVIASGDTAKFSPLLKPAVSSLVVLYFEMFITYF